MITINIGLWVDPAFALSYVSSEVRGPSDRFVCEQMIQCWFLNYAFHSLVIAFLLAMYML